MKKICVDYVMSGFNTLKQLPHGDSGKPLRFVYASGAKAERDQTKKPMILGDYTLMRVCNTFEDAYSTLTCPIRAALKRSY